MSMLDLLLGFTFSGGNSLCSVPRLCANCDQRYQNFDRFSAIFSIKNRLNNVSTLVWERVPCASFVPRVACHRPVVNAAALTLFAFFLYILLAKDTTFSLCFMKNKKKKTKKIRESWHGGCGLFEDNTVSLHIASKIYNVSKADEKADEKNSKYGSHGVCGLFEDNTVSWLVQRMCASSRDRGRPPWQLHCGLAVAKSILK